MTHPNSEFWKREFITTMPNPLLISISTSFCKTKYWIGGHDKKESPTLYQLHWTRKDLLSTAKSVIGNRFQSIQKVRRISHPNYISRTESVHITKGNTESHPNLVAWQKVKDRFTLQKEKPNPSPPCPIQRVYVTESTDFKLHKESLNSSQPRSVRQSAELVDMTKRKPDPISTALNKKRTAVNTQKCELISTSLCMIRHWIGGHDKTPYPPFPNYT